MPVPGLPTGFTATANGLRVDLSWTNPGTQNYIKVFRRIGSNPFLEVYNGLSFASKWYDTGVRPNTTYDYQLAACNSEGCSANTSTQSASVGSAPSPVGSLSVSSSTVIVGEVVLCDGRNSTGFSKRPRTSSGNQGKPSVILDFGDGDSTTILAAGHMYRDTGVYTVRLNGRNAEDAAATEVTQTVTVTDLPAATHVLTVTDSGNATTNATNLQNAINTAAANNTGSNYYAIKLSGSWSTAIQGPITMTVPSGSNWILIYWDGLTVPHKKRVKPADMSSAPIILNNTSANQPAVTTGSSDPNPSTHHYIWRGVHFKRQNSTFSQILFYIGQVTATQIEQLPHHFIVDRCWFDGGTGITEFSKDGMNVVADYVTVMSCYFAEFKQDAGADPTGMTISGGRGPYAVWNNEMVADGENFSENHSSTNMRWTGTVSSPTNTSCTLSSTTNLNVDDNISFVVNGFRGAEFNTIVRSVNTGTGAITFDPITVAPDNGTTAEWHPVLGFLDFRNNYLWKQLAWWEGSPYWNGQHYNVKNLWESKSSRYHTLRGNVLFQGFRMGQAYMVVLGSACGECRYANTVRNYDISYNLFVNMPSGISITSSMPSGGFSNGGAGRNHDFYISHNVQYNVGQGWDPQIANDQFKWNIGSRWEGTSPSQLAYADLVERVFQVHNTYDNGNQQTGSSFVGASDVTTILHGQGSRDGMFVNNVMQDQGGGFASQLGVSDQATNIKVFHPPGDSTTHNKNLVVNTNGHTYPTADLTASGWTTQFVDFNNRDMTLVGSSAGKNAAEDGTDAGADIAGLRTAIGASSAAFGTANINTVTGDFTGTVPPSNVTVSNVRLFIQVI